VGVGVWMEWVGWCDGGGWANVCKISQKSRYLQSSYAILLCELICIYICINMYIYMYEFT